ncbi:MAG TPA: hypothetical protein VE869_01060, partial [Gemmatimonas sp.]|nr:hypothetical protein [Gemmatimonas sp.]
SSLGSIRRNDDWEVASISSSPEWVVELRIRLSALAAGSLLPRIALRAYDNAPERWMTWPLPPVDVPATRLERVPDLWVPLRTITK